MLGAKRKTRIFFSTEKTRYWDLRGECSFIEFLRDRQTRDNYVDAYEAWVVSSNDYYPFGLGMGGRIFASPTYRYGFNGKEKDESGEWGSSTHYDYGFRIYNPSIARFLSVDPLTQSYPWYTPYQFAGNTPIWAIDLDGLEEAFATDFYDENAARYKREWALNSDATQEDIGKVQFKYSDGTKSEIIPGSESELDKINRMKESIRQYDARNSDNATIAIFDRLDGPTTAEKPQITLPIPSPNPPS